MIAIDLGSNTIRFLAGDENNAEIWEMQYVVGTARDLNVTGEISAAAIERIIDAVNMAKSEFDFSAHKIAAVATQAFRQAKNQAAAIEFLREKTGILFEVISSDLEAKLTALAASKSAQNRGLKTPYIILDIGGASTETIYVDRLDRGDQGDRGDLISFSLPIGIVTISERKFCENELKLFMENELEKLNFFRQKIVKLNRANTFIATAGAPTTIAAIKMNINYENYDKTIINGVKLTISEITEIYNKLSKMGKEDREILTGKSRSDLVLTGAVMLIKFMEFFGCTEAAAIDEGLREGVLMHALS